MKKILFLLFYILLMFFSSCKSFDKDNIQKIDRLPNIFPDYLNVTIPRNITPMNFTINEDGKYYFVKAYSANEEIVVKSKNGKIQFPQKSWRNLITNNKPEQIEFKIFTQIDDEKIFEFQPFKMQVVNDSIDPYIVYRLIHPGYYNWSNIKVEQRSLENFKNISVVENQLINKNCINCHSFNQQNPNQFLIHIRGSNGGTYFIENENILRTNLKIKNMPGGATYPSWHPGGRFVAFSSNQVRQNFYAHMDKSIEVFDLVSSLILYDIENNKIFNITEKDSVNPLQTFPTWSIDGEYLYFCSAGRRKNETINGIDEIKNIHYNLVKKKFNKDLRAFGKDEIIFNAAKLGKSVSFPKISPNGKYIVFTLADYGTFPIWHQEADLYMLNLEDGDYRKMKLNSGHTESYHSWSSNGKWLVFSSKKLDGRSTRPFFAYIDSWDKTGKPFLLPQKDPEIYHQMLESYNIPEFVNGKISVTPADFESAVKQKPLKSLSGNPKDTFPRWVKNINSENRAEIQKGIHE